ncbi:MAG TPA: hypothetical protein VKT49_16240 [Bryobacteraceae bacterium]|nr:hypothetical protein [Bryobacteraceae bacterium]
MRIASVLLILLSAAACNRGGQNKDAVRQGVVDYLSGRKDLNIASMDVDVTAVQFDGNKADATVTFAPKGVSGAQGMTMRYQLEQQGGRWTVVGRQDSGHAGAVPPGAANPHGGGAVPEPEANPHGGGGVRMPSPEDLPPTGGKK